MNRLVIIGNGFDLAHGLPTSYRDFINYFWSRIPNTNYLDNLFSFSVNERIDFKNVHSFTQIISQIADLKPDQKLNHDNEGCYYYENRRSNGSVFSYKNYVIKFSNSFFGVINTENNIQYWVDIENEYYKLLKECLKEDDNTKVKKLNDEFEEVKRLLEDYLRQEVVDKFEFNIHRNNPILRFFCKNSYEGNELSDFYKELSANDVKEIENRFKKEQDNSFIPENNEKDNKKLYIEDVHFLSFNYTSLVKKYVRGIEKTCVCNEIHGELKSEYNPINFGFGDEMDKRYSEIEEKDDNEYLKNIKSFAYSNTPNYKALLDLIDSDKFQVYIMGHSCGLSDRTLLNTIFEHHNCRSIKVFYHKFDKPKPDGRIDNYTEIIQNISRHFNKKEMMREKIVNKTLCQPLPQMKLPLKENSSQM